MQRFAAIVHHKLKIMYLHSNSMELAMFVYN
jgi:hypothetical protein